MMWIPFSHSRRLQRCAHTLRWRSSSAATPTRNIAKIHTKQNSRSIASFFTSSTSSFLSIDFIPFLLVFVPFFRWLLLRFFAYADSAHRPLLSIRVAVRSAIAQITWTLLNGIQFTDCLRPLPPSNKARCRIINHLHSHRSSDRIVIVWVCGWMCLRCLLVLVSVWVCVWSRLWRQFLLAKLHMHNFNSLNVSPTNDNGHAQLLWLLIGIWYIGGFVGSGGEGWGMGGIWGALREELISFVDHSDGWAKAHWGTFESSKSSLSFSLRHHLPKKLP